MGCNLAEAAKFKKLLFDLNITKGNIKERMQEFHNLTKQYDADLQRFVNRNRSNNDDTNTADNENSCNTTTTTYSVRSELAICAFIGSHLFSVSTQWIKFDDWKSILFAYNDSFAVHHDHFSGVIYSVVHKRCNSKVRIGSTEFLIICVYAHFGSFDFAFLLRGIDVDTLLNIQMSKQRIKLIGAGSNRFDYMLLGTLFFKDSMKMFPSSLAELCTTKTDAECLTVSLMIYEYLSQRSEYFKSVYTSANAANIHATPIINEEWRSLFMNTTSQT